jgi:hypothetical protein
MLPREPAIAQSHFGRRRARTPQIEDSKPLRNDLNQPALLLGFRWQTYSQCQRHDGADDRRSGGTDGEVQPLPMTTLIQGNEQRQPIVRDDGEGDSCPDASSPVETAEPFLGLLPSLSE